MHGSSVATRSPCSKGRAPIPRYRIPKIGVGEKRVLMSEERVRTRGVQIEVIRDETCVALMREFIAARLTLSTEDLGSGVSTSLGVDHPMQMRSRPLCLAW